MPISTEFEPYLDFWLKGQKRGFAGELPRIKLSDGSKMVALCEHPKLYVDCWYGSDLGGGQTVLYILSEPWKEGKPLNIVGTPIARLGYSGQIVKRINDKKWEEYLRNIKVTQSEFVWGVLKTALSQASRERPFRGPKHFEYPDSFPRPFSGWYYESEETGDLNRIVGHEHICFRGISFPDEKIYEGNYDFTLIKKNLEDALPVI